MQRFYKRRNNRNNRVSPLETIVDDMCQVYNLNLIPTAFDHYADGVVFIDPLGYCIGRREVHAEKVALRRIVSTTCRSWELVSVSYLSAK